VFKAFTQNSKTLLSVDFDRFTTCSVICDYCYVGQMEKIYPAYKGKTERNDRWARSDHKDFAQTLNAEYGKACKSKSKPMERLSKLPVRIYGAGDYIPVHYKFMKNLGFKFYIISKSLTEPNLITHIDKLTQLDNLTTICLSFDNDNLQNHEALKHRFKTDKIKFTYTGYADDFNQLKNRYNFDIFFNISSKKVEQAKSRLIKEQCPCDSGALAHAKSCSKCSKCWRSTITKGKEWNTFNQKKLGISTIG